MKITTLIENSPGEHFTLRYEHGISFLVEKDGLKILFDTGQSDGFIPNASKLQIDLSDIDAVVLSHGHYDHSGGFRSLCSVTKDFKLFVGEGFFTPKFALRDGAWDFLGNDFDEAFLKEQAVEWRYGTSGADEIFPGVFLLSKFPRLHPEERVNPRFYLRRDGAFVPDPFDDEVLLAVETGEGLAVLLGCAHPGMRNMLDAVKDRLGRPIRAVLGGSHLVEARGEGLAKSIRYLQDSGISHIGMSHCTGEVAMGHLRAVCPGYFHNRTGSSLYL